MPSTTTPTEASDEEGEGAVGETTAASAASAAATGIGIQPSSYRMRSTDVSVWPEPFSEAVALRVAVDATREGGRLAAAPAVATLFQVCSAWHNISHSELLWQNLTLQIWSDGDVRCRHLPTWRMEYSRRHRTACNFHTGEATYSPIVVPDAANPLITARCLALSESHLAVGFVDGSIHLFELPSSRHLAIYGPHNGRDLLGPLSRSVSGIILDSRWSCLVFASQDGDIYVAPTRVYSHGSRRAREGNVVEDGTLVDFSGSRKRWVGLFAGVPGRSLQVWNGSTEELIYVGGTLTDADSVTGWRMLTDMSVRVGRVRVANPSISAVLACTSSTMRVLDIEEDVGAVIAEEEFVREVNIEAVDSCNGQVMVIDSLGVGRVFNSMTLEEVCRFSTLGRGARSGNATRMSACLNWGHAVVCHGGRVSVWDAATGESLYQMQEGVGWNVTGITAVAATDRYIAVWSAQTGLHLWDFDAL